MGPAKNHGTFHTRSLEYVDNEIHDRLASTDHKLYSHNLCHSRRPCLSIYH